MKMGIREQFLEEVSNLKKGEEKTYPNILNDYAIVYLVDDPEGIKDIAEIVRKEFYTFTIRRL